MLIEAELFYFLSESCRVFLAFSPGLLLIMKSQSFFSIYLYFNSIFEERLYCHTLERTTHSLILICGSEGRYECVPSLSSPSQYTYTPAALFMNSAVICSTFMTLSAFLLFFSFFNSCFSQPLN